MSKAITIELPLAAETEPSFDELFERYAPYVGAIAVKLLGREDDVDDVVQEVFLAAFKGLQQLREPKAIKGWLATITVRKSQRHLLVRKLKQWIGLDDEPLVVVSPAATPEQKVLVKSLYAVLEHLPVGERTAWTLRRLEDEPVEEVARLIGCSLATAKRRIAAAQFKIDEAFHDE